MPSYIVHSLVMYGDEMNKNVTEKKKTALFLVKSYQLLNSSIG